MMGLTVALGVCIETPGGLVTSLADHSVWAAVVTTALRAVEAGIRGPVGLVLFGTAAGLAGSLVSCRQGKNADSSSTRSSAQPSSGRCTLLSMGASSLITRTGRARAHRVSWLSGLASMSCPTRASTPFVAL